MTISWHDAERGDADARPPTADAERGLVVILYGSGDKNNYRIQPERYLP